MSKVFKTIRFKIGLAFCIILFMFTLSFLYSEHYLGKITRETGLVELANKMVFNILQIKRHEKNFILRGEIFIVSVITEK